MTAKRAANGRGGKAASKRTAKSRAVQVAPELTIQDNFTDKEWVFAQQYFIHNLNGTEAALATFDTTDRSVASVIASEYLAKPKIREYVNSRLDEYHMGANEVLARMAFHARGSMEEFLDSDSLTIDLKKAKAAKKLGLIKKFRTKFTTFTDKDGGESETVEIEIELYDAQASLRDLGKHLGLFQPEVNINNFNMLTDDQLEALASGKPVRVVSVAAESAE